MKKMLTILSCLMIAILAFGQWDMVKGPIVTENPSDAVALDSSTILTILDNVVKKTTDFGASWTEILLPDGVDMAQIAKATDKIAYTCGDDGFVYKTVNAGDTWTQVGDTASFTVDMFEMDVLDANTVFISGGYKVSSSPSVYTGWFFKTTDGGANWDTTVVSDQVLDGGVAFTTALNGIVFDDGVGGIIHVTDDGGDTWTDHAMALPFGLSSKRMYKASKAGTSTFLVSAYHNIMWLSTDAGANWAQTGENTYGNERMVDVQCFDDNNFIAFSSETHVFTTSNGGANWDTLRVGSAQSYKAHAYSSMTNGMIWSDYGQTYSTVDGSTFVPMQEWPSFSFYSLTIPSEDKMIATGVSGGEISMTDDGGTTWSYPTNVETGAIGSIYASASIDADTVLIGGSSGYIAKSTDGGSTWTVIDNPMVYETYKNVYMLYVAPNGDVYAGGSSGWLLVSDDNGDTWTQVEVNSTATLYGMTVFSNGKAFLGGSAGRWCMSTSTVLDTFDQVADYGTMSFREAKERNGVILIPANDDIYTINDDMDSLYSVFDIPGGNDAYALEWVSDTVAFFVGSKGDIYRTDDAGTTWEQEFSGSDNYIYDVKYDGEKLWAVGKPGVIMSRDILEVQADYSEEFTDGTADLTWLENTAAANLGGLNLTVAADSAGLTNVGIYVDDANTGLLYADTGKKLKNYEISADIYCVRPQSATEPTYKGIAIKVDPVAMKYYRFVYRNSSSSNGALKFGGYDGASWYGTTLWNAGEDFDSLETGFHNLKAQVIDNKFWCYIDGELLPGCPISQEETPALTAGYPGLYVYGGNVEFDNFNVNVYEFEEETAILNNDVPSEFVLEQNYPNPFNPATTLKFQIPNADMVAISIYNVAGRKVAEVMNEQLEAGFYTVNFNASALPSGVYLYRLTAGEFSSVKKMTLLK